MKYFKHPKNEIIYGVVFITVFFILSTFIIFIEMLTKNDVKKHQVCLTLTPKNFGG